MSSKLTQRERDLMEKLQAYGDSFVGTKISRVEVEAKIRAKLEELRRPGSLMPQIVDRTTPKDVAQGTFTFAIRWKRVSLS